MRVGIFGSQHAKDKLPLLRRLFEQLETASAEVWVENEFYSFMRELLHYAPPVAGLLNETEDRFNLDIALSVGGDGTFLRTAARINRQDIPILGINTGRLGFLADIGNNEIENTLEEIFKNYYKVEERTLLEVHTEGKIFEGYNFALNEVAILKRDTSSMINIHTSLDGNYLTSYQADGLVIATPTGSTAYSLSVNGPILVPQSNSIVLSPVAPHSLNVRPLVIPDTTVVSLSVESRSDIFLVALDGRSEVFPSGAELKVKKSDYTTKIIKRHNHTFYQTLREKLMWGADPRKK